jgi:hypothetical protein
MLRALALDLMGRRVEGARHLRSVRAPGLPGLLRLFLDATLAVLEGDSALARRAADDIVDKWQLRDPCATYYLARSLAVIDHPRALEVLRRCVEGGFHPYWFLTRDPWLDGLRTDRAFRQVLDIAEAGRRDAARAFLEAGGERILGPVQ